MRTQHVKYCIVLLVIILACTNDIAAQGNYIYRNHYLHPVFINPAVSGSEYIPVMDISHQKQWLGISGSPQTLIASTSLRMGNFDFYNPKKFVNKTKLRAQEKVGMGIGIYSDWNGPLKTKGINMSYAYHIAFRRSRLALGLGAIVEQNMLDERHWDPAMQGDPILGDSRESIYHYNANAGAYYYCPEYFAGLSFNYILPLIDRYSSGERVKQDVFLHGGYMFRRLRSVKFEPSAIIRLLDYKRIEYDLSVKTYFRHVHWIAVSYRSYQAIRFMAAYKFGRIHVAYSYEANVSPVFKYNAGTHGIDIGLNLGLRRLEGF